MNYSTPSRQAPQNDHLQLLLWIELSFPNLLEPGTYFSFIASGGIILHFFQTLNEIEWTDLGQIESSGRRWGALGAEIDE